LLARASVHVACPWCQPFARIRLANCEGECCGAGAVRLNHLRQDLVRSMEVCPASPPTPGVGRGRLFDHNIWPDFRVFRIQRQPFLKPRLGVRLDRVDRAFRTQTPQSMHSPGWMTSMFFALVEAVHGAHLDAVHDFAANTALVDDEGPIKRPFRRSQRRPHSWCRSVLMVLVHWLKMDAQKTYVLWLNRNTEEQALSGPQGPCSAGCRTISPPKCVQSWQTPICRRAPLVARVDSTWCRARRIAVRSVVSSEIYGAHQKLRNGSRTSAFLPLLVSRRLTLRPVRLEWLSDQVTHPASSALMACVVRVPRVVALKFRECRRGSARMGWHARRSGAPSIGPD